MPASLLTGPILSQGPDRMAAPVRVRPKVRYSLAMPKDDEKLLRQLSLVSFLLGRDRPATAAEIRDSVEGYALMTDQAFARRFYGDREDLQQTGIVIETMDDLDAESEGQAYYLPEENYYLPDLELSEGEIRSLTVALALLEGHFAYARPLRLALVSLTHGRPNPLAAELDGVAVSLAPDAEARELGKQLARLEDAITRRKSVTFPYFSPSSGRERERRVDPYGLFRIGGHWYVVGRDHDRGEERTFRLGRVTGPVRFASKNARDFEVPASFDPERHRARPPWLLGDPVGWATFRICEDLAWWVQRSYPQVETIAEAGVSGRLFRTPYSDPEPLLAWILACGHQAELLEPLELRDLLAARLQAIQRAHLPDPTSAEGEER